MCKLIRRIICITILAVIGFLVIAVMEGGEPFRWFGRKTEETGKVLRKKSDEIAEEADRIRKKTEKVKKHSETLRKATEKIMRKVDK